MDNFLEFKKLSVTVLLALATLINAKLFSCISNDSTFNTIVLSYDYDGYNTDEQLFISLSVVFLVLDNDSTSIKNILSTVLHRIILVTS